jgi:acetoacetyl-CoA synthetase
LPKPIVHGHGGMLMNTLKSLAFEWDLRRGDRFFWYTSSGWIMWNLLASAPVVDCTVCLMDGSPGYPDAGTLWRFAADAKADFVGTSPAFVGICMKAGIEPAKIADLSRMRTLGCSGSPLSGDAYRWIYRQFGADVFLASGCGGTDVAGGIVGSNPLLPLHEGEMQCRLLGVDVAACDEQGRPLEDEVGEMMIGAPMPSMPLCFWNDADGRRYRESYFSMAPAKWRQGDWQRITPRGGAVYYGRSDDTLNRQGVRMGTAELYRAIEAVPEVLDSLVVDLEYLGRASFMPLFVQLRAGSNLDLELKNKINEAIRTAVSARFIPDEIFAVAEIPRTLTGKKMELPVRNLLLGRPLEKVASRDAMANPASLDTFVKLAASRALPPKPPAS